MDCPLTPQTDRPRQYKPFPPLQKFPPLFSTSKKWRQSRFFCLAWVNTPLPPTKKVPRWPTFKLLSDPLTRKNTRLRKITTPSNCLGCDKGTATHTPVSLPQTQRGRIFYVIGSSCTPVPNLVRSSFRNLAKMYEANFMLSKVLNSCTRRMRVQMYVGESRDDTPNKNRRLRLKAVKRLFPPFFLFPCERSLTILLWVFPEVEKRRSILSTTSQKSFLLPGNAHFWDFSLLLHDQYFKFAKGSLPPWRGWLLFPFLFFGGKNSPSQRKSYSGKKRTFLSPSPFLGILPFLLVPWSEMRKPPERDLFYDLSRCLKFSVMKCVVSRKKNM